jgi:hypothetical protein
MPVTHAQASAAEVQGLTPHTAVKDSSMYALRIRLRNECTDIGECVSARLARIIAP